MFLIKAAKWVTFSIIEYILCFIAIGCWIGSVMLFLSKTGWGILLFIPVALLGVMLWMVSDEFKV